MFVNFSNHPSAHWDEKQIRMARCYGDIVDIPFPDIPPEEDEAYITSLTERYVRLIVEQYSPQKDVVHIMGEMCFSFQMIRKLQKVGFVCLASTSERMVREMKEGYKEVYFQFVRFRKYNR